MTVSLTRDVIDLLKAYVCSFIDAAFNRKCPLVEIVTAGLLNGRIC